MLVFIEVLFFLSCRSAVEAAYTVERLKKASKFSESSRFLARSGGLKYHRRAFPLLLMLACRAVALAKAGNPNRH